MGFDMFSITGVIFPLFFLGFFVAFFIILFRSLKQWNKNNHSPRLTVEAMVVGRRDHRSGGGHNHSAHTTYYITFQGTRFISFERI